MLKELRRVLEKYEKVQNQGGESVEVGRVINDIAALIMRCKLQEVPKPNRGMYI